MSEQSEYKIVVSCTDNYEKDLVCGLCNTHGLSYSICDITPFGGYIDINKPNILKEDKDTQLPIESNKPITSNNNGASMLKYFLSEYKTIYNRGYMVSWKKHGSLMKRMLETNTPEEIEKVIKYYLKHFPALSHQYGWNGNPTIELLWGWRATIFPLALNEMLDEYSSTGWDTKGDGKIQITSIE